LPISSIKGAFRSHEGAIYYHSGTEWARPGGAIGPEGAKGGQGDIGEAAESSTASRLVTQDVSLIKGADGDLIVYGSGGGGSGFGITEGYFLSSGSGGSGGGFGVIRNVLGGTQIEISIGHGGIYRPGGYQEDRGQGGSTTVTAGDNVLTFGGGKLGTAFQFGPEYYWEWIEFGFHDWMAGTELRGYPGVFLESDGSIRQTNKREDLAIQVTFGEDTDGNKTDIPQELSIENPFPSATKFIFGNQTKDVSNGLYAAGNLSYYRVGFYRKKRSYGGLGGANSASGPNAILFDGAANGVQGQSIYKQFEESPWPAPFPGPNPSPVFGQGYGFGGSFNARYQDGEINNELIHGGAGAVLLIGL